MFDCVQDPLVYYRLHEDNFTKNNRQIEIRELEEWFSQMKKIESFFSIDQSKMIHQLILYKKIMFLILNGKLISSFFKILKFSNNFKKIKLLLALIIPKSILKSKKEF